MPDKSQKTEQPTTRRITKARQQGQIPNSQELTSAVGLVTFLIIVCFLAPSTMDWFKIHIKDGLSCRQDVLSDMEAFSEFMEGKLYSAAMLLIPYFAAVLVGGFVGSISCGGYTFTFQPLRPDLNKFNPIKGIKQLFNVQSLVKLVLALAKIIFVIAVVYNYLRGRLGELADFRWLWPDKIPSAIGGLVLGVVIRVAIGMLVIGIIDAIYQKYKHKKDLKMTKQEVKDERKQSEGPPEVKQKIRNKQFEAAMRRMMQEVPKADVVLVNPTHVAVAVKYDSAMMQAPMVVAKGGDHMCEKIKEIARAYGVPIIRKPELARTIYYTVDVDQMIPETLFVAVAEVLAMIYRLRHARSG